MEVFTHSNDTLASLRRSVLRRIKASVANVKLELFVNGEPLDTVDDRKLLSQIPLRDKMVILSSKSRLLTFVVLWMNNCSHLSLASFRQTNSTKY